MSLFTDAMEECRLLVKTIVEDDYGGYQSRYVESDTPIYLAITFDTSIEARRADKEGVTSLYTVSSVRSLVLEYHDVFRRVRDNKIFRVTSDGDDKYTPKSAGIDMRQVTAEEWELPKNEQSTSNS